jgi:hypothetical protein
MRSILLAVLMVLSVAVAVPSTADARCGIFGYRAGAVLFRPFARIRERRAARQLAAASGCSDCAAHGVGPDGFPLKK